MNRAELVASMNRASSELLREKGFISFIDVLIHMGKLTNDDHESWRMKRIRRLAVRIDSLTHAIQTS